MARGCANVRVDVVTRRDEAREDAYRPVLVARWSSETGYPTRTEVVGESGRSVEWRGPETPPEAASGDTWAATDAATAYGWRPTELVTLGDLVEPPPPPYRLPIGASTWTAPEMAELEIKLGTVLGKTGLVLAAQRDFAQVGPWDVNQIPRVLEDRTLGRTSLLSFKAWPTDAQLGQLLGSIGTHPTSLTFFHEPTNPSKGLTGPGWNGQIRPLFEKIKSHGIANVGTRFVFMGYDFDPTFGTPRIEQGWLDPATLEHVDVVSIDPYNPYGYNGSKRWLSMEQMLTWVDVYAERYGFADRLAIDETACPEDGGDKPAWIRAAGAAATERKLRWLCYYDVEQGEIASTPGHRAASTPESLTALAELVAAGAG